jgi:prepilin-type N-terminal cleavage/methylation domain-containing protein/prepilin-type processing-associated H-X9-DG protein
MRKKGFTLVELLVVIAIIALLMSILMPALSKVRELATRVVCGSHLASIGKQMMVYANDQEDNYPRAGGKYSKWGPLQVTPSSIRGWCAWPIDQGKGPGTFGEPAAFGIPINDPVKSPNRATISSSLYYLIKFADASPKAFVCGGDAGVKIFQISEFAVDTVYNNNILEAWDFGPSSGGIANTRNYYSYALQFPYVYTGMPGNHPLSPLSDSSIAIAADSSPYIVKVADLSVKLFMARIGGYNGTIESERMGNSENHKRNGQNVLYNDGHVAFADNPCVGFDRDNIYSMQTFDGTTRTPFVMEGSILANTTVREWNPSIYPFSKTDSLLLNEGNCILNDAADSQGGTTPIAP